MFRSVSHLGKNLVAVARETMQAENVSLWEGPYFQALR